MKIIGIIGNAGAFEARIKRLGYSIEHYSWKDLEEGKIKDVEAVLFFPDSEELNAWREPSLKEAESILKLAQSGVGVYTERLKTYGWRMRDAIGTQRFLDPRITWRERAFIVNAPEPFSSFGKGDILDCTGATYAIGRSSHEPILTVGNVGGVYCAENVEGEGGAQNSKHFHVLYKLRDGRRQLCANIDISNCDEKAFFPRNRWHALIDRIVLYLLDDANENAENPKSRWTVPVVNDRKASYEKAILKNIEWTKKLMPAPDGSEGVYEGYDTYGHVMWEYRAECQTETALFFHRAGEYFGDDELKKIADNIISFTLKSGIQITDEKAEDYGLWHFYKQFREDSNFMYIDTAARAALGLLYLYESGKREDCLQSAEITLDALMKMANENGVLPDCVRRSNIKICGIHGVNEEAEHLVGRKHGTPHHHSSVVSSFVKGYQATGKEEYLNFASNIQKALDRGFPDDFEDHFVCRFTMGRYLLGLSSMMQTPLKDEFMPSVRKALEYILPLQHESGAFLAGVFGDLAGCTFETGIVGSNDDEITDNLYTNNYLGVALQNLPKELGFNNDVVKKLLDFQVAIQDLCGIGEISGGWTRAFNLRTGDPFAFNGDIGWGAYCMLTGWSNSVISLSLLMSLTDKNIIL